MTYTKPKAIFFDLDETLIENKIPVRDLFARMYFDFRSQLGAEQQTVFFNELRVQAADLWNTMFDRPESPEQQFIRCFKKCIFATGSVAESAQDQLAQDMFDQFVALSSNNVVLHDDALSTLAELSERGFITGIITNGIEQVQLGKIRQLDLQHKVSHVTVSAQARAHKPRPAVFNLALERASVRAAEAWQVGDHATNDVAGAIRAGMGGVFYDPQGDQLELAFSTLEERPTHTVNRLSQTLELV